MNNFFIRHPSQKAVHPDPDGLSQDNFHHQEITEVKFAREGIAEENKFVWSLERESNRNL
jgi:hypothetical protein